MSTENKPFPRSTDFKNGLVANNTGDEFIAAYIELQAHRAGYKSAADQKTAENFNAQGAKPPVEQSVPDNFSGR